MSGQDRKYDSHPSWAMLEIGKTSGLFDLFGSHVQHQQCISLRIKPAQRAHDYGHDFFYSPNRPYIEVQMTVAQFAEAITTLNGGMGTPCTLRYLEGKQIDRPPQEKSEADRAAEHVKVKANDAAKGIDDGVARIEEIFAKATVGKNDRAEILKLVQEMGTRFKEALPFYVEMYVEATEKVKARAMIEFESMVNSKLQSLGLTAAQVGIALPEADKKDDL